MIEEDFLSGPAAKKPAMQGPLPGCAVSNGIEMESDSEDDDILPHIPPPKVSLAKCIADLINIVPSCCLK